MNNRSMQSRRLSVPALATALIVTAATFAFAMPAQAADNCGAQFNDSNAPDDAQCTFSCKAAQQLTIAVDASDHDATASGSARCGGGYSPCTNSGSSYSCRGEDGISKSASTSGTCAAVVDEWWDSAWSYNCATQNVDQGANPTEPEPGKECIWGIVCCPPAICATREGAEPAVPKCNAHVALPVTKDPYELLETTAGFCTPLAEAYDRARAEVDGLVADLTELPLSADPVTGLPAGTTSRVDVWVVGQTATGRLCNAGVGCWVVAPDCTFDTSAGRAACVVSGTPKVLGIAPPFEL